MTLYAHDCDACVYLGQHTLAEEDGHWWGAPAPFDLYACPQSGWPTVAARFSDDGPDYVSGMGSSHPALLEAACRAVVLNLLPVRRPPTPWWAELEAC